jgi:hypothetical protein
MSRRAAWRRFFREPLEVREPDLDQWLHGFLETCRARDLERLFVALPGLLRARSLFETIVARNEKLLNTLPRLSLLHSANLTTHR